MSTEIYHFSASGNSLAIAKELAGRLNGYLVSIPTVVDQERIHTDADVVGLVFPVYYANLGGSGVPRIIVRFIGKLHDLSSKYIFAVCTHSGAPGSTIENLSKMIASCNGQLAAGFTVKMSVPYSPVVKLRHFLFRRQLATDPRKDVEERQKLMHAWEKKLEAVCQCVSVCKKGPLETRGRVAKVALAPLAGLQNRAAIARYRKLANSTQQSLDDLIPLADRSFRCNLSCSGCGICARVCPVHNIQMVDRKPVWQHNCETCYACFHWCTQGAIDGEIVEYEKRQHHPGVKLADMLGGWAPGSKRS